MKLKKLWTTPITQENIKALYEIICGYTTITNLS